jgi:hypothetical protein
VHSNHAIARREGGARCPRCVAAELDELLADWRRGDAWLYAGEGYTIDKLVSLLAFLLFTSEHRVAPDIVRRAFHAGYALGWKRAIEYSRDSIAAQRDKWDTMTRENGERWNTMGWNRPLMPCG